VSLWVFISLDNDFFQTRALVVDRADSIRVLWRPLISLLKILEIHLISLGLFHNVSLLRRRSSLFELFLLIIIVGFPGGFLMYIIVNRLNDEVGVVLEAAVGELILGLWLDANLELVINERDDHAVEERDQVGWLVVLHLLMALHEHKRPI